MYAAIIGAIDSIIGALATKTPAQQGPTAPDRDNTDTLLFVVGGALILMIALALTRNTNAK